uniref:Importin N-terminal domain-containing protein n=1 Tax=Trypanosoma vivax (strain Y486) TaxID=1055687 RepID=G0U1V9_TRYVY|nr:conserved hypothetical protein, fragment [Trypanosoma vivax Y486]
MQFSDVSQVDCLAEQMYSSPDPIARQQAQVSLEVLTKEGADRSAIYAILQQSNNQYTLFFMAQSLVSWFKSARKWLSEEEKQTLVVTHCGGCLKRIFENGAPKHVVSSLLSAYAKVTKLAFEKTPVLEGAVSYPLEMLQQGHDGSSQRLLGLMMLNALVVEFSKFDSSRSKSFMSFIAHRHCSNNFNEDILLKIFIASLKELESLRADSPLVSETVKLVENCLSCDFRALLVDETEELPFVHFPASWKTTILSDHTLRTLWGQHATLPYPHCASILVGITNICGIYRTFFETQEERAGYIQFILARLTEVTMLQDGRLKIPRYVELFADACRRVVVSLSYRDLCQVGGFESWVSALCPLSVEVLSIKFGQEGSFAMATSVLSFWAGLAISKGRTLAEQRSCDIEHVLPQILQDVAMMQSEAFANITLLDPPRTLSDLATYLNQSVGTSILSSPISTGWLFYLAGSLAAHVLFNIEGPATESCSHVFAYVRGCAEHRQRRDGDPVLFCSFVERGVLHFIKNMQSLLVDLRQCSVSTIVTNVFQNRTRLFQFVLDNVGHNIMRSADSAEAVEVIRLSADLITDACREVPSSLLRELSLDLPAVSELPLAQSQQTYKLRTNVMKLLWFLRTTGPYTRQRMESYLCNVDFNMQQPVSNDFTSATFVAGWLRDLRGACQAMKEYECPFGDFIDWFFIRHTLLLATLEVTADFPVVVTALMRFLCELITPGKYGTLHVSSSSNSAVGLTLFQYLCLFIAKVEARTFSAERIAVCSFSASDYDKVLKPWMLSMDIVKKCIQGSFVPFGAMIYYNDDTFEDTAVRLLRKLAMLPRTVFKEYSKFTSNALDFLRLLTEENLYFPLRRLTGEELLALVGSVIAICEDVDIHSSVLLFGLSFLSFIASLVREVKAIVLTPAMQTGGGAGASATGASGGSAITAGLGAQGASPAVQPFYPLSANSPLPLMQQRNTSRVPRFAREVREYLAGLFAPHEDLWQRLLSVAMNIIVFQDRAVNASSAVVYPIFEAHPPFWYAYIENLVSSYPEIKRSAVREALSVLTNAAEAQDKFFSEVYAFRNALRRFNG